MATKMTSKVPTVSEEELKSVYYKNRESSKVIILEFVASCARTFKGMSTEELISVAISWDSNPFSYFPEVVEALVFELNKRHLEALVSDLMDRLSKVDWYARPWLRK